MTITREQVVDLQPGDIVELTDERWPGMVITGPVTVAAEHLLLGPVGCLRCPDETAPRVTKSGTLTVISRAPRPLYVNHDRTEPVAGDVVHAMHGITPVTVVFRGAGNWAIVKDGSAWWGGLPEKLTLLVDGTTGQVVPQ